MPSRGTLTGLRGGNQDGGCASMVVGEDTVPVPDPLKFLPEGAFHTPAAPTAGARGPQRGRGSSAKAAARGPRVEAAERRPSCHRSRGRWRGRHPPAGRPKPGEKVRTPGGGEAAPTPRPAGRQAGAPGGSVRLTRLPPCPEPREGAARRGRRPALTCLLVPDTGRHLPARRPGRTAPPRPPPAQPPGHVAAPARGAGPARPRLRPRQVRRERPCGNCCLRSGGGACALARLTAAFSTFPHPRAKSRRSSVCSRTEVSWRELEQLGCKQLSCTRI
ncbi:skin secretory protein xP2-like [Pipra filicauda]|uniref:Skin secretory protein xP2-like n=1 Tax=Pipra filicauda TaxID=649802 RepID=A0A7R5L0B2_9PASS|nr:skin secretory protein xP2-like [Pipra filicauda]